jgi:hypothetical protein
MIAINYRPGLLPLYILGAALALRKFSAYPGIKLFDEAVIPRFV